MSPKLSPVGLALVLNLITAVTVMAQPDHCAARQTDGPSGEEGRRSHSRVHGSHRERDRAGP